MTSELSTMTRPSWVALPGIAHNFIELHKAVIHVIIWSVFCDRSWERLREEGEGDDRR